MFASEQRVLRNGLNVPAHIRQRSLNRLRLTRDPEDPFTGWVINTDGKEEEACQTMSRAEVEALEDEVIDDILTKREARTKQSKTSGVE